MGGSPFCAGIGHEWMAFDGTSGSNLFFRLRSDLDRSGTFYKMCLRDRNMILYKVHVRGYTKQAKLPASVRGTFLGLTKMIPYWKELGINAVELMPAYEFEEISAARQEEGLVALRSKETNILQHSKYLLKLFISFHNRR